jgi:hypothetical protein
MNTGPTPDFQEVTEGSCNLSDTSTIVKADVDCNSVTVQNQEFGVEHTQPDLLDPKSGEGEADISDLLIYSQWACGRKGLPGEGLTEILFGKNLF